METILTNYPQVFDDSIGKFEGELHLHTSNDVTPHKTAPREIRLSVKNNFIAEVKDLQQQGIIEKGIKRSEYPIPTADHLLTDINNAKVFSLADIKTAFWHVPLDAESSLLTTFNTPLGRMKWKRMPFGISVAPEEFQRRIDDNLEGLEGVKAIADDILIWGDGENFEEATASHDKRLLALLE